MQHYEHYYWEDYLENASKVIKPRTWRRHYKSRFQYYQIRITQCKTPLLTGMFTMVVVVVTIVSFIAWWCHSHV